ncbi:MAG: L,D-transpeptidase family protein [Porcipelethomonas sp.]
MSDFIKKISGIFLAALVIILTGCSEIGNSVLPSVSDNTAGTSALDFSAETSVPEQTVTEQVTEGILERFFIENGFSISGIENSGQVITVQSDGTDCVLTAFEKSGDMWNEVFSSDGIVGRDGVSYESSEYNSHTPKGLFPLGFAFGTEQTVGLSIEYRVINENCYWVDDGESEYYNQWVESEEILWDSAEHLIDYPESYKYAVEIKSNWNPVVPYGGSAIFIHCDDGSFPYTAGCVAVPEDVMEKIIYWLDESLNPKILII